MLIAYLPWQNVALAASILAIGALLAAVLAWPPRGKGGRFPFWIVWTAFAAAPATVLIGWALPFIVPNYRYAQLSDAWAVLPPLLFIGFAVGVVSAIAFAVTISLSRLLRGQAQERSP
jgi:hypothetical protein